jgi:hypothetical protein
MYLRFPVQLHEKIIKQTEKVAFSHLVNAANNRLPYHILEWFYCSLILHELQYKPSHAR